MKLTIAFLSTALVALSAQAYKDGSYTCRSTNGLNEANYKFTTLTVNGTALPYLEVTRTSHKDPADPTSEEHVYKIKGIATQFLDNTGKETLTLGALTMELKAGQPGCIQ